MNTDQILTLLVEQLHELINRIAALEAKLASPVPVDPRPNPQTPPPVEQPQPVRPVLIPFELGANGHVKGPEWVMNGDGDMVCAKDFWMNGVVGCQKGAYNKHYSTAHMILSMIAGDFPKHLQIVTPVDKDAAWITSVKSAGDLGWIENKHAPEGKTDLVQVYHDWIANGAPTKDMHGHKLNARGAIWVADQEGEFSPGKPRPNQPNTR